MSRMAVLKETEHEQRYPSLAVLKVPGEIFERYAAFLGNLFILIGINFNEVLLLC